ncbi:MAG: MBL fold metallo-hydrolase [Clostridia bacterium]|nr:MBL fold metallo-hydrolase [Clostridia bacterium]
MQLSFLGAARQVTGSCCLLEADKFRILIDCGLFQGGKSEERLNRLDFRFNPSEIDCLVLTHAHIDHSGRIPKLIKDGFRGRIICTKATADLLEIMLKDSAHIQEKEAEWQNRKNMRAGRPLIEPLYTVADAEDSLRHIDAYLYDQMVDLNESIRIRFNDAGHILGSSIVEIWINEGQVSTKLVFSGDIGNWDRPILKDPSVIDDADYIIMETTYGDRVHDNLKTDTRKLVKIINNTVKRGGNVVIPSFAIGRTQEIIYELNKFYEQYEKVEVDYFLKAHVYIDSPLAVSATDIFKRNSDCFDEEANHYIMNGDNPLEFENLHLIKDVQESIWLNKDKQSKIIISASGMCDAGRIKHHLKHNLWREDSSIVFVGYQAQGTLGRDIKDGAKNVKIFGEDIAVNADIYSLEGFSAHADRNGLLKWVKAFKNKPKKVFLVHGEEEATIKFKERLVEETDFDVVVPELGSTYRIDGDGSFDYKEKLMDDSLEHLIQITCNVDELKYDFYRALSKLDEKIKNKQRLDNVDSIINKMIQLKKDINNLSNLLN